jgi:alpha-ribazole phosphatase
MIKNTEFIFVRHGATDLNAKKLYFGHLNPSLNNDGIKQIQNAKKILAGENIDYIYSSDLKRCIESAKIINTDYNLNITEKKEFRELNFGIFEGKNHDEITTAYPVESGLFFKDWKNFRIPEGESIANLMQRTTDEIKNIKNVRKGKSILIITHSGVIQAVLSYYFSKNLDAYWKFRFDNGSVTKLCFDESGFSYLEYVNRV